MKTFSDKLWVYGCSFSEPFGLVPNHLGLTIMADGIREFYDVDYWATHLARKLGITEIVHKGMAGIGWNYIQYHIDNDILKWGKDDLIIISPSFLSRVTIMEFENGSIIDKFLPYFKNWNEITEYNEIRWRNKIKTLQHFGYNVYTWLVDNCSPYTNQIDNLITAPGDLTNWKDWMDLHLEYWIDPTRNVYPDGDWHFNPAGHIAVADRMYEFIISNK